LRHRIADLIIQLEVTTIIITKITVADKGHIITIGENHKFETLTDVIREIAVIAEEITVVRIGILRTKMTYVIMKIRGN